MSTKITYNGKTTELADGYIATLPCKDYKMATDVVVEAPEPAEVPTVEEWDGTGVVIEGLVKLISFTVDGTSYQAVEGMTWNEWLESDYNTDNYSVNLGHIIKGSNGSMYVATSGNVFVTPTDTIIGDHAYIMNMSGEPA